MNNKKEQMGEEVKLLGAFFSPFSMRVEWALQLKGVNYEYIEEDLRNKSELLLKYNPLHKKIPVLLHNGKPIVESAVILEYIDQTWPHNPLLPDDPYDRAIARFWRKFRDDKTPTFVAFLLATGEEHKQVTEELREILKIIEEKGLGVADKKFFCSNEIGLTDLVYGWLATGFRAIEEIVGVKLVDADSFPRLHAWTQNFRNHPVLKNNLPDHGKLVATLKSRREMLLRSKNSLKDILLSF